MHRLFLKFCGSIAVIVILCLIPSCSDGDGGTGTPNPVPGDGISSPDFAFAVGNEWNYNGDGYDPSGSTGYQSHSTIKFKISSETNANGLNGFNFYSLIKDYQGHSEAEGEGFLSLENNGLWTLEKLPSGSTSPLKLLPLGVASATIRSETVNNQYWWTNENASMNVDIRFQYLGKENVSTPAGDFTSCKKIKIIFDVSQRSDTNDVEIFNGKTWYVESIWWLASNNGLVKTETSFNCVIDSILVWEWDPINQIYISYYEGVFEYASDHFSFNYHNYDEAEDFIIWFSENCKPRVSGLNYFGKYVTLLSSKNF